MACAGDIGALKELGDRLDGKATEHITIKRDESELSDGELLEALREAAAQALGGKTAHDADESSVN